MEIQKLLKPRYKVIASYPSSKYEVGSTIENIGENYCMFLNEYPHLFRKLEWWEERRPEDMPEYVKLLSKPYNGSYWEVGAIVKVIEWKYLDNFLFDKIWIVEGKRHVFPATKEEYETFKNKS